MPKLSYMNIAGIQKDNVHGNHTKDQIVLHETISPDYKGWADIRANSEYLDAIDYGIHGINDLEGNIAWSYGLGTAIFWHTRGGNTNTRAIGIEQVSRVPSDYRKTADRIAAWAHRRPQINATAKMCAAIHKAHPHIPLVASNGVNPGITTHWLVTRAYNVPGGHTDCWPIRLGQENLGGYFPLHLIVSLAKRYNAIGYTL